MFQIKIVKQRLNAAIYTAYQLASGLTCTKHDQDAPDACLLRNILRAICLKMAPLLAHTGRRLNGRQPMSNLIKNKSVTTW